MYVTPATGHEGEDTLQHLALPKRQRLADPVQDDGDRGAQADGHPHAQPHRPERPPLTALGEEGGDDAHDERGLEALTEADDEGREHERSPWSQNPDQLDRISRA